MTSKFRRCDVVTSHRRRYDVMCLLGICPPLPPQYSKPCPLPPLPPNILNLAPFPPPPPPPNILNLLTPMNRMFCETLPTKGAYRSRPRSLILIITDCPSISVRIFGIATVYSYFSVMYFSHFYKEIKHYHE